MWNKIILAWRTGEESWCAISPIGRGAALMILSSGSLTAMHSVVRYLSSDMHPFEVAFFRNIFGFGYNYWLARN